MTDKELMQQNLYTLEHFYEYGYDREDCFAAITNLRERLAQPEQEPVDKSGSPCPEFWDWLPKAYNFDGDGVFTKYNMEVAFLAGKQSVHAIDTLQERVDEAPKKVHDKLAQQQYQNTADNCELTPVPAKGGLQADYRAMYLKVRDELAALQQSRSTDDELNCVCGAVWQGDELVHLPRKPARKPWVGLTDEEYSQLHDGLYQQGKSLGWVVDQAEAKLREKNGGAA